MAFDGITVSALVAEIDDNLKADVSTRSPNRKTMNF